MTGELFGLSLSIAVPLQIAELEAQGGPTPQEIETTRALGIELASRGDVLLFGGRPGEAGALFARVARGIAVLSFCPGGVRIMGQKYEGHIHSANTERQ